jgi:hypothetical protein
MDEEIDELYDQIQRELLTYMMADPHTINRATKLLMVARYLERCGDHLENVNEHIVFWLTGSASSVRHRIGGSRARRAPRYPTSSATRLGPTPPARSGPARSGCGASRAGATPAWPSSCRSCCWRCSSSSTA